MHIYKYKFVSFIKNDFTTSPELAKFRMNRFSILENLHFELFATEYVSIINRTVLIARPPSTNYAKFALSMQHICLQKGRSKTKLLNMLSVIVQIM